MKFANRWLSKSALTVLDFGATQVTALTARRRESGDWQLMGRGESAARGYRKGCFDHLGDAVDSILEALRAADRSSGLKTTALWFNFDDAAAESIFPRGSKQLAGEGQILREDVREAVSSAERLVMRFEKTAIYTTETGFVIDDRDAVLNPVGVFGRKLEVSLHTLWARAELLEQWKKAMRRAGLRRAEPVFSGWSTVCGLLQGSSRGPRRLIWDLGADTWNGLFLENGRILDCRVMTAPDTLANGSVAQWTEYSKELIARHGDPAGALITGDLATAEAASLLSAAANVQTEVGISTLLPGLSEPRLTSAVGLLQAAEELRGAAPAVRLEKDLIVQLKDKASNFLSDYF